MPNSQDYRAGAYHLRRSGELLLHRSRSVRRATDPSELCAGPLRTELDRSLGAVDAAVERAAGELERLAAICDRRAEICAAYAAELARHRETFGRSVPPPEPPAWWVRP